MKAFLSELKLKILYKYLELKLNKEMKNALLKGKMYCHFYVPKEKEFIDAFNELKSEIEKDFTVVYINEIYRDECNSYLVYRILWYIPKRR